MEGLQRSITVSSTLPTRPQMYTCEGDIAPLRSKVLDVWRPNAMRLGAVRKGMVETWALDTLTSKREILGFGIESLELATSVHQERWGRQRRNEKPIREDVAISPRDGQVLVLL